MVDLIAQVATVMASHLDQVMVHLTSILVMEAPTMEEVVHMVHLMEAPTTAQFMVAPTMVQVVSAPTTVLDNTELISENTKTSIKPYKYLYISIHFF